MIVEITLGKSRYKINCSETEKNKIINNANKLDSRLKKIGDAIDDVDDKTLLVLCGLMMQEEINQLNSQKKLPKAQGDDSFGEDDIYDSISENIENINSYIEKLITRIQDY